MNKNKKTSAKPRNEKVVNRRNENNILGSLMEKMKYPTSDSGYSSGEQVVRNRRTRCEERRFQQRKREQIIEAETKSNQDYYSHLKAYYLSHLEVPEKFKINHQLVSGMKASTIQTKEQSHPGVIQSNPGLPWSHPGFIKSHPGVIKSHPGVIKSHLGVIKSHLGVIQSHHGVIKCHPGVIKSHHGVIKRHPEIDCKQDISRTTPCSSRVQKNVEQLYIESDSTY